MAYVISTSTAGSEQELFDIPVQIWGFWLKTDGTNNPTVTITDKSTGGTGETILNAAEFDASTKGLNGALWKSPINCKYGLSVNVTTAGTYTITVLYS